MSKYSFLFCLFFCFKAAYSQTPEDAMRNAWFIPNATARSISIGGAMGSLGGDISSIYTNPAGLGFYKTKEAVITPGFLYNNNQSNYRGSSLSNVKKSAFQFGASGVIIGGKDQNADNSFNTFSLAVNQIASYNNHINYTGVNNYSSYSEQYLEELVGDNADVNAASNNYPYGSSLAFLTYLVDSVTDAEGNLAGYRSLVPVADGIMQQYNEEDKGGLYEVSVGFASNKNDKLYLGASINLPLSFFTQDINYQESDISSDINNNFNYSILNQHYTSTGGGLNARLGIIYRLQNNLRLGFAFHTPSFMSFTDKLNADITTDTEGYAGTQSESSNSFNNGSAGENQYNELTPWRAIASASFVLGETENVKLQKGFVTADIEFVNYKGSRFYQQGDNNDPALDDYYNSLNNIIKAYNRGAFNFRIGGELKFSPVAIRLGAAYYERPYSDKSLKANRILAAGGLGYRNRGLFADVSFAEMFNKDVSFPYRLNDKANTFAELKNRRSNILLTIGMKF